MGTDWRVEERLREKLALLSQELSETQAALDAVRADLAASEKARKAAERGRDEARRCLNAIPNWHPGCAKDHIARFAEWLECWICKEEAAESRAARLLTAMKEIRDELGVPQPGYPAPVANAARIARAALAAEEGK